MGISLASGVTLAGRYRLAHLLGEGGMGQVWAAVRLETDARVALKLVREAVASPDARRRLLREARAAVAVRHPNVVEVIEIFELDDGSPVMVMELLSGETLAARLHREHSLTPLDAARVMLPVISAVGCVHALGIIHRDLKPENIFLARANSSEEEVKVLDFGIAKLTAIDGEAAKTTGLTATGGLLGTPAFMSPEQVYGEKDLDHRVDVWAICLILYQCLSGVLPTQGDNVGQVLKAILSRPIPSLADAAPDTPRELCGLVDRMLARNRDERPPDLREARDVLMRHADVSVPSFDGPTVPMSSDASSSPRGAIHVTPAGGATPSAPVDVHGQTADAAEAQSGPPPAGQSEPPRQSDPGVGDPAQMKQLVVRLDSVDVEAQTADGLLSTASRRALKDSSAGRRRSTTGAVVLVAMGVAAVSAGVAYSLRGNSTVAQTPIAAPSSSVDSPAKPAPPPSATGPTTVAPGPTTAVPPPAAADASAPSSAAPTARAAVAPPVKPRARTAEPPSTAPPPAPKPSALKVQRWE